MAQLFLVLALMVLFTTVNSDTQNDKPVMNTPENPVTENGKPAVTTPENPVTENGKPVVTTQENPVTENGKPEVQDVKEQDGEEEFDNEYIGAYNRKIHQYLRVEFNNIKKQTNDERMRKAMGIVEELIKLSWIKTLTPNDRYIPRGSEGLEKVKENIIHEIEKSSSEMTVADAILLYSDGKEKEIKDYFETQKKDLEKSVKIALKELKKTTEPDKNQEVRKNMRESKEKLQHVEENIEIHKIARKMYLQSYILNFLQSSDKPHDHFMIKSKDGMITKSFTVPSFDSGIFMEEYDDIEF